MDRPLQLQKRAQDFIGAHDETLSVAMRSTIQIVRPSESMAETPVPTPTGFAQIVSDYFPNASSCRAYADEKAPTARNAAMKYWEVIADNLSKAGWS
jgi:hypothetical protein